MLQTAFIEMGELQKNRVCMYLCVSCLVKLLYPKTDITQAEMLVSGSKEKSTRLHNF